MDLVKREDTFTVALAEVENTRRMCEVLLKTPHYAKMGPDGIYAVLAKARSMDIDPMDALNGALYYVNGRVGMSTEAMAARMRTAGHSIQKDIQKSSPNCCVLIGKRADNGDVWETSFSIEDAKRAGIYNDRGPWGKYPSVMCYNRAMSMMFRQLTPDLSKGAGYTLDELKEIAEVDRFPSVSFGPPAPAAMMIEIVSAEQVKELKEIFEDCDPAYLDKVWESLRKSASVGHIEDLPAALFERIRTAAMRNRAQYQASLHVEPVEVLEEEPVAMEV